MIVTSTVVMFGLMYRNAKANLGIFAGSAVVFALALWLVRSQATVEDVSWMRAMIPHHSIAILTSERRTSPIRVFGSWPIKSSKHNGGRSAR